MRLGNIAREVKETVKSPLNAGIERLVGLEHLDPEGLKISRWGSVADGTTFTKRFREGQILFGRRRAYQKKAAIADFEGVCSGDITVIEAIPGKVHPELLPYIIQNDDFFEYAISESAGSLSPRVKWKHLSNYEIALPGIELQNKIADLMATFDKSIQSKKDIIRYLGIIKLKLLLPGENDAPKIKLAEVFKLRRELIETTDENVKYVALEHIESKSGKLISFGKASDAVSVKSKFYKSDILFGKLRTYLRKYWLATEEGVCSTEILVLSCTGKCIPEYGFYMLQDDDFINYAIGISYGTKMPRVNWDKLSEYEVYLPEIDQQKRISDELKKIEDIIRGVEKSIYDLTQIKKKNMEVFLLGGEK